MGSVAQSVGKVYRPILAGGYMAWDTLNVGEVSRLDDASYDEVSHSWYMSLALPNCSEIWQASQQQHYKDAH